MKKKKILTEVFVLFFIAAVFMAVYVVIEMGNDWLAVLGGAAVLLIASYLLMDYRIECGQDGKEATGQDSLEKRLDDLEEVQKAIYTVIKRGNSENAELLQKMDEHMATMAQTLEMLSGASVAADTVTNETCKELLQTEQKVLDTVKGLRQDYQTGVKNLIKYEKENAKQIAETAHNNTEMTIMELNAQLARIQECLQAQSETLAAMPQVSVSASYSIPETEEETFEFAEETETEDLLPVLEDAKQAEEPSPETAGVNTADSMAEGDADDFDAEAAIKAYMIEQGYVDAGETDDSDDSDSMITEPVEEAPAQKSEEEIASTLQSMASGDPNRALTPEEIAAMFAAIQ